MRKSDGVTDDRRLTRRREGKTYWTILVHKEG